MQSATISAKKHWEVVALIDNAGHSSNNLWITAGAGDPIEAFPGVQLWTTGTETLMLAMVRLAPGADVPPHAHENEQAGAVVEGTMAFTIDGETKNVSPGQGYVIPADVEHSAIAGPNGALVVEVFSPPREAYRMPGA